MKIKCFAISALIVFAIIEPVHADDAHLHQHGGELYHMFRLETEVGSGRDGLNTNWDLNGWIGTDEHKLWLKSEGEVKDGNTEQSEYWALYSMNVDTFWDAQVGLRHDTQPQSTTYLVAGFNGLAQYFFETEAHLFISDEGDLSARIRQENEFLVTQRMIVQPYLEANLFAQDVEEQDIGEGLSSAELGLQLRYEFTRKFAPYLDFRYERLFGETSSSAEHRGDDNDDMIISMGLRLLF